jgi:hypothetical protein
MKTKKKDMFDPCILSSKSQLTEPGDKIVMEIKNITKT